MLILYEKNERRKNKTLLFLGKFAVTVLFASSSVLGWYSRHCTAAGLNILYCNLSPPSLTALNIPWLSHKFTASPSVPGRGAVCV